MGRVQSHGSVELDHLSFEVSGVAATSRPHCLGCLGRWWFWRLRWLKKWGVGSGRHDGISTSGRLSRKKKKKETCSICSIRICGKHSSGDV